MNYVERNAAVGFGQPIIRGRRLTVFNVVTTASIRSSVVDYLAEFDLSMEELKSAVSYCKNRECEKMDLSTDHYCDGCILRSIGEGWESIKDDFVETDGVSVSKDGKATFLGSIEELEDSEFGVMGWVIAEGVEKRLSRE